MTNFTCTDGRRLRFCANVKPEPAPNGGAAMSTTAIVSYDDTLNDHDALTFARLLGEAGAEPILAYVRHTDADRAPTASSAGARGRAATRARSRMARRPRRRAPGRGQRFHHRRHAGGSPSRSSADIVVFGSDYRTAAGHVAPAEVGGGAAPGQPGSRRDRARQLPQATTSRGSAASASSLRRATMPR